MPLRFTTRRAGSLCLPNWARATQTFTLTQVATLQHKGNYLTGNVDYFFNFLAAEITGNLFVGLRRFHNLFLRSAGGGFQLGAHSAVYLHNNGHNIAG